MRGKDKGKRGMIAKKERRKRGEDKERREKEREKMGERDRKG